MKLTRHGEIEPCPVLIFVGRSGTIGSRPEIELHLDERCRVVMWLVGKQLVVQIRADATTGRRRRYRTYHWGGRLRRQQLLLLLGSGGNGR